MKFKITIILVIASFQFLIGQGSSNGLSFDGVNDYIRLDNYALVESHSKHTVEMWVKSSASENGVIYSEGDQSSNYRDQYRLIGNGHGKLSLFYRPSNYPILVHNVTTTTTVFDGTWHHIALVGNGNSTIIYVDGIKDATNFNYNRPPAFKASSTKFGAQARCCFSSGQFSLPYSGELDELRLWSTNRSQIQIRENMCQKLKGSESNLEVYYPLNQSSGTRVFDVSTINRRDGYTNHSQISSPYASWILSGAPVGDVSVCDYSVNLTTSLNMVEATNDDFIAKINSIRVAPHSIHLYRVDNAPDNAMPPGSQTRLSSSSYYGIKIFGGEEIDYTAIYNYAGHLGIVDENTLELATRDDNSDLTWNQEFPLLNSTANSLILTSHSSSEFILADVGTNSLPIELLDFNAMALKNGSVKLEWQTASEKNNDYFMVERTLDGSFFEDVTMIEGSGNSNQMVEYEALDLIPFEGVSYYRLKQVDYDSKFEYSDIKQVVFAPEEQNVNSSSELSIYPNPVKRRDVLSVELNSYSQFDKITLFITNAQGITIHSQELPSLGKKVIFYQINANYFPGVYFVNVHTEQGVDTMRLVIN